MDDDAFKCNLCSKEFIRKYHLARHQLTCSKEQKNHFKCAICDEAFGRKDNLQKHIANFHPHLKCRICDAKYLNRSELQDHLTNKHLSAENQRKILHCEKCNITLSSTREYAQHVLDCGVLESKKRATINYSRECDKCKTVCSSAYAFRKHTSKCGKEADSDKELSKRECVVEGCHQLFFHTTAMISHMIDDHNTDVESFEYTLESFNEFEKWKEQIEGDTCTSFTAPGGLKKTDKFVYRYYTCQLEAPDTTHRKSGMVPRKTSRRWQTRGCIPKGQSCPARMLVREDIETKKVVVTFVESHNHEIDYKHNKYRKVPKSVRLTIISLLTLGMEPKHIKSLLRGRVGALDQRDGQVKPKKEHFINEMYIRRLKYHLKTGKRYHSSDSMSLDIHVRNLINTANFKQSEDDDEVFSPVLLYKPQGAEVVLGHESLNRLSKDTLLLGIQSREQLKMLQQGAQTVVCIDFTYKISQYDFYLCNIIVPDEFGKGYPVAHFITNKQDEETLVEGLKSIKLRCPDLRINFLMTDDDQSEWKAMQRVFGSVESPIRRGLCKYHLFRTWQRKLQGKDGIADLKLRREVYHALTVLCHERVESKFLSMMEGFIYKYRPLCNSFVTYFVNEYSNRPQVWALCYRNFPHGCTDTNMYCESFHNKIKTFYLERRQNKRVDELLKIVLESEVDRYLEHLEMRLEERGTSTVPISHQRRHSRGLQISDEDVAKSIDSENDSEFWIVKSQSKDSEMEEYYITMHLKECNRDFCFEKCEQNTCFGLCSHLYTCTCPDASAICKHIHKVHSFRVRMRDFRDMELRASAVDFTGQLHHPVQDDEAPNSDGEGDSATTDVEKWRAKCVNYVEELKRNISASQHLPMLQFMANQLQICLGHCSVFENSAHAGQLDKLVPTMSVSGTQKVVPYKDLPKFYRTTKKYQSSKENKLCKPSYDERNERKRDLISAADDVNAKRLRNIGPADTELPCEATEKSPLQALVPCQNQIGNIRFKPRLSLSSASKTLRLKSFTPKLGFCNNINQSVLFLNGADGNLLTVTFRGLKSIDPFLTSAESSSLSITSITGTMPSPFQKGWLFEEVINFYLHFVCRQNPVCHYLSSSFAEAVFSDKNVSKFLNFNINMFSAIFIPFMSNRSWSLIVCRPQLKKFELYDPSSTSYSSSHLSFLEKFCKASIILCKDINNWSLTCCPRAPQIDSASSGVYVCYYAYCISRNKSPSDPIQDVSEFRKLIYNSIVGNCFKTDVYCCDSCVYCKVKIVKGDHIKCSNCHQLYHPACVVQKHSDINLSVPFKCV